MTTDRNKKVILVVIDGLTPSMFEAAVGDGRFPALSFLAEQGRYSRAV
jgi:predicted AlkP superfamily pyrophosphatase or phosphodiesterase